MKVEILFEDAHIIVCEKPTGVPSQSDKTMDVDMVNYLKNYRYEKEGMTNPYLGLVHRLDRPVGGVMVFGKTKEATAALSQQLQNGGMDKRYLAVVTSTQLPLSKQFTMVEDYLVKDGRTNLSRIVEPQTKEAKKAPLEYRVLMQEEVDDMDCSLVEVHLFTGRHHQIRVQLANLAEGIWGDTKYNARFQSVRGWRDMGLYSYALSFSHPVTKEKMEFTHIPSKTPFRNFRRALLDWSTSSNS